MASPPKVIPAQPSQSDENAPSVSTNPSAPPGFAAARTFAAVQGPAVPLIIENPTSIGFPQGRSALVPNPITPYISDDSSSSESSGPRTPGLPDSDNPLDWIFGHDRGLLGRGMTLPEASLNETYGGPAPVFAVQDFVDFLGPDVEQVVQDFIRSLDLDERTPLAEISASILKNTGLEPQPEAEYYRRAEGEPAVQDFKDFLTRSAGDRVTHNSTLHWFKAWLEWKSAEIDPQDYPFDPFFPQPKPSNFYPYADAKQDPAVRAFLASLEQENAIKAAGSLEAFEHQQATEAPDRPESRGRQVDTEANDGAHAPEQQKEEAGEATDKNRPPDQQAATEASDGSETPEEEEAAEAIDIPGFPDQQGAADAIREPYTLEQQEAIEAIGRPQTPEQQEAAEAVSGRRGPEQQEAAEAAGGPRAPEQQGATEAAGGPRYPSWSEIDLVSPAQRCHDAFQSFLDYVAKRHHVIDVFFAFQERQEATQAASESVEDSEGVRHRAAGVSLGDNEGVRDPDEGNVVPQSPLVITASESKSESPPEQQIPEAAKSPPEQQIPDGAEYQPSTAQQPNQGMLYKGAQPNQLSQRYQTAKTESGWSDDSSSNPSMKEDSQQSKALAGELQGIFSKLKAHQSDVPPQGRILPSSNPFLNKEQLPPPAQPLSDFNSNPFLNLGNPGAGAQPASNFNSTPFLNLGNHEARAQPVSDFNSNSFLNVQNQRSGAQSLAKFESNPFLNAGYPGAGAQPLSGFNSNPFINAQNDRPGIQEEFQKLQLREGKDTFPSQERPVSPIQRLEGPFPRLQRFETNEVPNKKPSLGEGPRQRLTRLYDAEHYMPELSHGQELLEKAKHLITGEPFDAAQVLSRPGDKTMATSFMGASFWLGDLNDDEFRRATLYVEAQQKAAPGQKVYLKGFDEPTVEDDAQDLPKRAGTPPPEPTLTSSNTIMHKYGNKPSDLMFARLNRGTIRIRAGGQEHVFDTLKIGKSHQKALETAMAWLPTDFIRENRFQQPSKELRILFARAEINYTTAGVRHGWQAYINTDTIKVQPDTLNAEVSIDPIAKDWVEDPGFTHHFFATWADVGTLLDFFNVNLNSEQAKAPLKPTEQFMYMVTYVRQLGGKGTRKPPIWYKMVGCCLLVRRKGMAFTGNAVVNPALRAVGDGEIGG